MEEFKLIRDVAKVFENVGQWFGHVYPERKFSVNTNVNEQKERVEFLVQIEYEPGKFKQTATYVTFDQANGKDVYFIRMVKDRLFDALTKAIRESMAPTLIFNNPMEGKT